LSAVLDALNGRPVPYASVMMCTGWSAGPGFTSTMVTVTSRPTRSIALIWSDLATIALDTSIRLPPTLRPCGGELSRRLLPLLQPPPCARCGLLRPELRTPNHARQVGE